jgi:hypothetical protein
MKRLLGLTSLALTLLAILGAVPLHAASPAAPVAALAAAVPVQPGCQPPLDLGKALKGQGATCPATAPKPQNPEPEFLVGTRTCRCSCGFPCKTNADCGPGGVCTAGITCC